MTFAEAQPHLQVPEIGPTSRKQMSNNKNWAKQEEPKSKNPEDKCHIKQFIKKIIET